MDPISIATCAGSLLITVGKISQCINEVVDGVRSVDRRISGLSKETTLLAKILASVETTMRRCTNQQLTLAHVDAEMWTTIHNATMDCIISVEKLDQILREIKSSAEASKTLFRRPKLYLAATKRAEEIDHYRDNIYKSNCAMQTSISVVNIALSLRSNASSDSILEELRLLRVLVHNVLDASQPTKTQMGAFDYRISQNLEALGKVAQRFHSSASSTASTRRDRAPSIPSLRLPPSNTLSHALGSSVIHRSGASRGLSINQNDMFDRSALSERTYMFGSEYGGLAEETRQRIERWSSVQRRDSHPPLHSWDETTESSTLLSEGTSQTEPMTNIAAPDSWDLAHSRQIQTTGRRDDSWESGKEETESDIETDIMADLLSNCEEIALEKFNEKDYYMAEQFLRKAIEESTGENSRAEHFGLLKFRLALCCCLQEKWEAASSVMASLTKSKASGNLSVFRLLHAIALAHLECDRIPEAYEACKLALQGTRKILGKSSTDYDESLILLAQICQKRGDSIEAEAVRHSLIKSSKLDLHKLVQLQSHDSPINAKAYIEGHSTLISTAFGPVPELPQASDPANATDELDMTSRNLSGATEISQQETKIPILETTRTGLDRAEEDDHLEADVAAMDTGKEFIALSIDSTNQALGQGEIFRMSHDVKEDISGRQVRKVDTVEEALTKQILSLHIGSLDEMDQDSRFIPYWPLSLACTADALNLTANRDQQVRARLDSNDFSDLELASPQQSLGPEGLSLTYTDDGTHPPYDEEDSGRVSPVSWTFKSRPRTPTNQTEPLQTPLEIQIPPPGRITIGIPKAMPHRRRSLGPVLESFVYEDFSTPSKAPDAKSPITSLSSHPSIASPSIIISSTWEEVSLGGETAMAIHLGINSTSVVASLGGFDGLHTCPFEPQSTTGQPPHLDTPFRPEQDAFCDHPQNFLRLIRLRLNQSSESESNALPDPLIRSYSPDQQRGIPVGQAISKYLQDVSSKTAKWLEDNRNRLMDTGMTLDALIVAVPDILVQSTGVEVLEMIRSNICSSSHLICSSLAIAAGFLFRGELPYWKLLSPEPSNPQVVIVLNCEEVLVECTSYEIVQDKGGDSQSATMSQLGLSKARLWGSFHAETAFCMKLLYEKLKLARSSSKVEPEDSSTDSLYMSARAKFRGLFIDDDCAIASGGPWDIPFDLPPGLTVIENGCVQFTEAEIRECFNPSVKRIREMLLATILELHEPRRRVTCVLMAGSYASCRLLYLELKRAMADLGTGITLLRPESDMNLAAARGAVCYALHQRMIIEPNQD
ncbi:hypothetical protein GQ53DRAFT_848446 [Thozetella sp. PMI_491]|nr:hypothetical protein GQ53DRAFT_848446 [Thozetella sp. PMI_491]